jgi:threonine/homoserine/homoserine lactone efflux protein
LKDYYIRLNVSQEDLFIAKINFMNLIAIFFLSFTIALFGALAPGPLLSAVISATLQSGLLAGPLIVLGHGLAELVVVSFILLGLARFLNHPPVLKMINFCGGLILLGFGVAQIGAVFKNQVKFESRGLLSFKNLVILGLVMSVSNPYWSIWWLTVGMGLLLSVISLGFLGIGVFFVGHVAADFLFYALVSWLVARGKFLYSSKIYKGGLFFCGLTLVIFGVYFLVRCFI